MTITLLALFSAGVHAYFVFKPDEPAWVRISFAGVAVGYVALLGALYLPGAAPRGLRSVARGLLIALAVALIVGYFVVGAFDTLGNITKAAEVLLVLLLIVEATAEAKASSSPQTWPRDRAA